MRIPIRTDSRRRRRDRWRVTTRSITARIPPAGSRERALHHTRRRNSSRSRTRTDSRKHPRWRLRRRQSRRMGTRRLTRTRRQQPQRAIRLSTRTRRTRRRAHLLRRVSRTAAIRTHRRRTRTANTDTAHRLPHRRRRMGIRTHMDSRIIDRRRRPRIACTRMRMRRGLLRRSTLRTDTIGLRRGRPCPLRTDTAIHRPAMRQPLRPHRLPRRLSRRWAVRCMPNASDWLPVWRAVRAVRPVQMSRILCSISRTVTCPLAERGGAGLCGRSAARVI
jgi:hypothetical protein